MRKSAMTRVLAGVLGPVLGLVALTACGTSERTPAGSGGGSGGGETVTGLRVMVPNSPGTLRRGPRGQVVAGPRVELQLRRALQISDGDVAGLFTRPLALGIYVLVALSCCGRSSTGSSCAGSARRRTRCTPGTPTRWSSWPRSWPRTPSTCRRTRASWRGWGTAASRAGGTAASRAGTSPAPGMTPGTTPGRADGPRT